ncbi:helix-turn-helix transcriptional regulator [Chromobacterium vaccinii]|uniref:helix-turn-helix transcriptional regulator n=1 Tax=Chromobacterium vaccinii TaxID=1108595 RepID=UPI0031DCF300
MTGKEFEKAINAAGYSQRKFAELLGVDRKTIGARCLADEVDSLFAYALLGVLAENSARQLADVVDLMGQKCHNQTA